MPLRLLLPAILLASQTITAADLAPAPPQTRPILLRGAVIHPVSGPDITGGAILLTDGKITALGPDSAITAPADAEVIELPGQHIYPGLISACTILGLTEIGAVRATEDQAEAGAVNPNARAQVAINPDSELLPVTRTNGILTALSIPQPGGILSGQSALIHLDGWTWEDMTVKAPVGIHLWWPDLKINETPGYPTTPAKQREDIAESLRKITDAFHSAAAYAEAKHAGQTVDTDLRWDALAPVLSGDLPLFIHASDIQQIQGALAWAVSYPAIRPILVGGADAPLAINLLKERKIPVIYTATQTLPTRRDDPYDIRYTAPAKLASAGVTFCIANDIANNGSDAPNTRNLPYLAAQASAYGLPPADAIKAITLWPAQIMGVGDRLGSLEPGKEATIIATTGDPLDIRTNVTRAWITGRPINLENRQTRLSAKYQEKLRRK